MRLNLLVIFSVIVLFSFEVKKYEKKEVLTDKTVQNIKDYPKILKVTDECNIFEESNGRLVMEAEYADLSNTNWELRNTSNPGKYDFYLEGYKGTGYIEYAGADSFEEPTDNAVIFTFKIQNSGTYNLVWRTLKNHTHDPSVDDPNKFAEDRNNDAWMKLEGDYEADKDYERGGVFGAELADLMRYTKFIGHGTDWGRTIRNEIASQQFREVVYKLKAGEEYKLYIIGRSFQFGIDRIYLFRLYDENGNTDVGDTYEYRRYRNSVVNGDYNESACVEESSTGAGIVTASEPFDNHSISFFPNPTKDRIIVDGFVGIVNFSIQDVQGKIITSGQGHDTFELDLSSLPTGVYGIKLENKGRIISKKIVKQ